MSNEIKQLRSLFKSFPISFQVITDFYEELIQLLKNCNDNTNDISLEKVIEYLQMVRNPSIYPLYQPPLTDVITDNAKIENIASSFFQLHEVNLYTFFYIYFFFFF